MPLESELLDYEITQFLFINNGLDKATEGHPKNQKKKKNGDKEKPDEEIEKLENQASAVSCMQRNYADCFKTQFVSNILRVIQI
jgi:hypothetical protein